MNQDVKALPVATVRRGGPQHFDKVTAFVQWEDGAEQLPDGEHQLYAESALAELRAEVVTWKCGAEQFHRELVRQRQRADTAEARLKGAMTLLRELEEAARKVQSGEWHPDSIDVERRKARAFLRDGNG